MNQRKSICFLFVFIFLFLCSCSQKKANELTTNKDALSLSDAAAFFENNNETVFGTLTNLKNSYYRLIQENELNVAYIGGSVTNGYAASSKDKGWTSLVTKHLEDKFPLATINSLNAAIGGTGTLYGAYRVTNDLKLKSYTPDLVFIEFAVNDAYDGTIPANSSKYMETIIRTIYSYAPNADIVMVFVTNFSYKGEDYEQLVAHQSVAENYNIPFINVGKALCGEMDLSLATTASSTEWRTYFADSVHPNDYGYEKYAAYITDYIDAVFYSDRTPKERVASYMPKEPITDILVNPEILNAKGNANISDFTVTDEGYLKTNKDGATLTVTFTGTSLNLWCFAGPNGANLEYTVDNQDLKTVALIRNSENHKVFTLASGLEDTQHTIKMTFKEFKDSSVDIRYFMITGATNGKEFSIKQ